MIIRRVKLWLNEKKRLRARVLQLGDTIKILSSTTNFLFLKNTSLNREVNNLKDKLKKAGIK